MSARSKIRERVQTFARDRIFCAADFQDLKLRRPVAEILGRLRERGEIRRIARGFYPKRKVSRAAASVAWRPGSTVANVCQAVSTMAEGQIFTVDQLVLRGLGKQQAVHAAVRAIASRGMGFRANRGWYAKGKPLGRGGPLAIPGRHMIDGRFYRMISNLKVGETVTTSKLAAFGPRRDIYLALVALVKQKILAHVSHGVYVKQKNSRALKAIAVLNALGKVGNSKRSIAKLSFRMGKNTRRELESAIPRVSMRLAIAITLLIMTHAARN